MFKEYTLKDLFISLLIDMPFYALVAIWLLTIGGFAAGMFFIVFCLISIERARNEEQDKQIHALKNGLDSLKSEFEGYKEQILEG